jgi:hypothetical protein
MAHEQGRGHDEEWKRQMAEQLEAGVSVRTLCGIDVPRVPATCELMQRVAGESDAEVAAVCHRVLTALDLNAAPTWRRSGYVLSKPERQMRAVIERLLALPAAERAAMGAAEVLRFGSMPEPPKPPQPLALFVVNGVSPTPPALNPAVAEVFATSVARRFGPPGVWSTDEEATLRELLDAAGYPTQLMPPDVPCGVLIRNYSSRDVHVRSVGAQPRTVYAGGQVALGMIQQGTAYRIEELQYVVTANGSQHVFIVDDTPPAPAPAPVAALVPVVFAPPLWAAGPASGAQTVTLDCGTVDCAALLCERGYRPAVLNFAHGHNCGGGFEHASGSQVRPPRPLPFLPRALHGALAGT